MQKKLGQGVVFGDIIQVHMCNLVFVVILKNILVVSRQIWEIFNGYSGSVSSG
jgi:hypothetical protein